MGILVIISAADKKIHISAKGLIISDGGLYLIVAPMRYNLLLYYYKWELTHWEGHY